MRLSLPLTTAAALAFSSPAMATGVMTCTVPQAQWGTQQALGAKLKRDGWKVTKIEIDGGCYEVYGTTPKGDRVEAYFHPATFENLYIARRGQVLFRKKGY